MPDRPTGLRWMLVAALVASTALFAIGVIAEPSTADTHTAAATARDTEAGGESGEPEGAHSEATAAADKGERLLGVDVESTPPVVLAVLTGLTLAVLAATRIGAMRGFLLAVAVIAAAWAALDLREVVHQLDEARTGIAVIAMVVGALHLAVAAIGARLATQAPGRQ